MDFAYLTWRICQNLPKSAKCCRVCFTPNTMINCWKWPNPVKMHPNNCSHVPQIRSKKPWSTSLLTIQFSMWFMRFYQRIVAWQRHLKCVKTIGILWMCWSWPTAMEITIPQSCYGQRWNTTRLNRWSLKWGRRTPNCWRQWRKSMEHGEIVIRIIYRKWWTPPIWKYSPVWWWCKCI